MVKIRYGISATALVNSFGNAEAQGCPENIGIIVMIVVLLQLARPHWPHRSHYFAAMLSARLHRG